MTGTLSSMTASVKAEVGFNLKFDFYRQRFCRKLVLFEKTIRMSEEMVFQLKIDVMGTYSDITYITCTLKNLGRKKVRILNFQMGKGKNGEKNFDLNQSDFNYLDDELWSFVDYNTSSINIDCFVEIEGEINLFINFTFILINWHFILTNCSLSMNVDQFEVWNFESIICSI